VAEATADSASEHIILDNLCLTTGIAPIRVLAFSGTPSAGFSLTVRSEPGHLYELQSSPDLGATGWQFAGGEIATLGQYTFTVNGPLAAGELYFRVVDRGEGYELRPRSGVILCLQSALCACAAGVSAA